jgi:hypothetical protein
MDIIVGCGDSRLVFIYDDHIKVGEMGGTCSTRVGEVHNKVFVVKSEGKRLNEKLRHRWEDNIKRMGWYRLH